MKIKQSFIDRCGEITINEIMAIATLSVRSHYYVLEVLLYPNTYLSAKTVLKAAATVLKINLSDIYEVEDLPHTL